MLSFLLKVLSALLVLKVSKEIEIQDVFICAANDQLVLPADDFFKLKIRT